MYPARDVGLEGANDWGAQRPLLDAPFLRTFLFFWCVETQPLCRNKQAPGQGVGCNG